MIGNKQFKTFYVSKEESNCPLIVKAIEIGKEFKKQDFPFKLDNITISLKYGKRLLMNADNTNIKDLKREDFLEIIDYDPLKKVMLLMGSKLPRIDTSVHWLIHHARDEINAVIQINDKDLSEKLGEKIPLTKDKYPSGTLGLAKEILKCLSESKKINIKNQGILFVGDNIMDIKNITKNTFEELK